MWLLAAVLIIYFPRYEGDLSRQYSKEVYHTLFGDITSLDDLRLAAKEAVNFNPAEYLKNNKYNKFVPREENHHKILSSTKSENYEFDDSHLFNLTRRVAPSHDHAEHEFHEISNEAKGITRRQLFSALWSATKFVAKTTVSVVSFAAKQVYKQSMNAINAIHNYFNRVKRYQYTVYRNDQHDTDMKESLEQVKEQRLLDMIKQFIIHTRHEIAKALQQRNVIREDKRYKIGYLFNRLRRTKTEQLKLLYHFYNRKRHIRQDFYDKEWENDTVQYALTFYERISGLDIDSREICKYIKELFYKKEPFDFVDPPGRGLVLLKPKSDEDN